MEFCGCCTFCTLSSSGTTITACCETVSEALACVYYRCPRKQFAFAKLPQCDECTTAPPAHPPRASVASDSRGRGRGLPLLQRSIAFHKRNHISQPKPRPTTTSNELQTTPANSSGCSQNASTLLSPFACLQSAIRTGGAASGGRIAAATTNNHQQQLTARNCNERTNARTNERTNERTSNCPRQQTAIRNRSIFIMENTVLLSYVYVD